MKKRAILIIIILFITNTYLISALPNYDLSHGKWNFKNLVGWQWEESSANYSKQPVLLVHGWSNDADGNTGYEDEWGDLQNELEKEFDVWRLDYYPANLSSRKNAGIMREAIGEILDKGYKNNGFNKIDIIAHSQGGLAVMGYINNMGIDKNNDKVQYNDDIKRVITISSPLYGSYFANIVDEITDINIEKDHPNCQRFINGDFTNENFNGKTESTKDLELGSDFTWELNKNIDLKEIDYLTISGRRIAERNSLFPNVAKYCLSNHLDTNDGFVYLINSNLITKNSQLIILDRFHSTLNSIKEDKIAGRISMLFLQENLTNESVNPLLNTVEDFGLDKREGELYHDPNNVETTDLVPKELTDNGAIIINISKSENNTKINNVSLFNQNFVNEYKLEENINTNRWFYIDKTGIIPGISIDFSTLLPKGRYFLYINNFPTNDQFVLKNKEVNLKNFTLDKDQDNYDLESVGGTDCNDNDAIEHPGQQWYPDVDNDGFRDTNLTETCARPELNKAIEEFGDNFDQLDCNDEDQNINPQAQELCNAIDDNCNIEIDEDFDVNTICSVGIGECQVEGVKICSGDQLGTVCNAIPKEPTEEICDGLDNNCDGEIDEGNICNVELTINTPIETLSDNRRIDLDISVNKEVDEITYIDNSESRPRERTLCRNCNKYDRSKSFRDGAHDIEIRAYVDNQIVDSKSIEFIIDSRDPRLGRSEPRRGFANGEFTIEFMEDNPDSLILNYGNELTGFDATSIDLDNCIEERNRVSCTEMVNLSDYDEQEIIYWFELTDIVGNTDNSREISLEVDNTDPIINDFHYTIDRRRVEFVFDINETNFDEITYIDYNDSRPRERRLCSRLRDNICDVKRSFRSGEHNLTFFVKDEAGNSISLNTSIQI